MAARDFKSWLYTANSGQQYVRRADSLLVAQQGDNAPLIAVGGAEYDGSPVKDEMPRNLSPRKVFGKQAASTFTAYTVIYTEAALAAITVGTTTFAVLDAGGTSHTCVVKEKIGEKPRRSINATG